MLTINFELLTTITEQKRTAYSLLSLFGDIGGLLDFIMLIVTPLVGYVVGDRFSYIVLKSLYMQNKGKEDQRDEANQNGEEKQKELDPKYWIEETKPYKESWKNQILLNQWV